MKRINKFKKSIQLNPHEKKQLALIKKERAMLTRKTEQFAHNEELFYPYLQRLAQLDRRTIAITKGHAMAIKIFKGKVK
jgi:hypothetical protein